MSSIGREHLDMAAIAVHRVLQANHLEHAFFGGYEMIIMGADRGTKDVDVVVKKPWLKGVKKITQVFTEAVQENKEKEFRVFLPSKDAIRIRAIHIPSQVGVDIMIQAVPKSSITLIGDPHHFPFFSATHMFAKKVECLSVRNKLADCNDLVYLWENHRGDISVPKLRAKVNKAWIQAALQRNKDLEHEPAADILREVQKLLK